MLSLNGPCMRNVRRTEKMPAHFSDPLSPLTGHCEKYFYYDFLIVYHASRIQTLFSEAMH